MKRSVLTERRTWRIVLALGLLGPLVGPGIAAQQGSFFGINNKGDGTRSLVRMGLDGSSSTIGTIVVAGGSPAGDVQAASFDTSGTLWATTNGSCGGPECLLEFPNPLTSALANNRGTLVFGGTLNIAEVAGMCPYDDGKLVIVDAGNGGTTVTFDPRNFADFTNYGGPASGDTRAIARFPDASWGNPTLTGDWIYCAVQGNQHCVFNLGSTTTYLPAICGHQGVHGMTAAPDGFLYAYDWVTKTIIKIRPSDSACVAEFGPFPFNQVLSLAYYNPCYDGACTDCDGNGVPDAQDIANGSPDCNGNAVPDVCEIASAVPLNGAGANPMIFSELTPAIIGSSWQTSVDLAASGAVASRMLISLKAPLPVGLPTNIGELLCRPPFGQVLEVTPGMHALQIPNSCAFIGGRLCAQAVTFSLPAVLRFTNALDVTIGAF